MSIKLSAALRNGMLELGSLKHLMSNCVLKLYTGSQPATAETAPSGTLLNTYSASGAALTREVRSQGSVTFSGTIGGSISALTVNSLEILGATITPITDVSTTATLVATQINNNPKNQLFDAYTSAGKVFIRARPGLGTLPNGWVVATTVATITKSDVNMGTETAGVASANGLQWGDATAGVLSKLSGQTWSGTAVASGTAGWFRIEAAVSDAGGTDSSEAIFRIDGAVGTSGAELNMASTTITSGISYTIDSFALTLPTA